MGGLRLRDARLPFAGITQIRSRGRPARRDLSAWKTQAPPESMSCWAAVYQMPEGVATARNLNGAILGRRRFREEREGTLRSSSALGEEAIERARPLRQDRHRFHRLCGGDKHPPPFEVVQSPFNRSWRLGDRAYLAYRLPSVRNGDEITSADVTEDLKESRFGLVCRIDESHCRADLTRRREVYGVPHTLRTTPTGSRVSSRRRRRRRGIQPLRRTPARAGPGRGARSLVCERRLRRLGGQGPRRRR